MADSDFTLERVENELGITVRDWFRSLGGRKACGERHTGIGRSIRIPEKSDGKG